MTMTDRPTAEVATETTEKRPPLPQIIVGGVLVLIGLLWLLDRTGAVDIGVTVVLGLAVMVIGIALMLLADRGAHGGLIVFGTILALFTLLTATAPFEGFQGGVGDRSVAVSSVEGIAPDYNLALGKLVLDLREIDDLEVATPLTASVGMGELIIRVPSGTKVEVDARVGAGQLEILGRRVDGVGIDESYRSPGLTSDEDSLVLQLGVFAGRVEVTDE